MSNLLSSSLLGCGRWRSTLAGLLLLLGSTSPVGAKCSKEHWVGVWTSMPQLVEPANLPNAPYNGTNGVFENASLRQTIYITQDAPIIRLRFSNALGASDLTITAATVALPANGSAGASAIDPATLQTVTFSGEASFTVPNGALVVSDPLTFPVKAQSVLAVTIYLASGQSGHAITGHPGSRTSSFAAPGNLVSAADLVASPSAQKIDHWYFLSAVDGWLPRSRTALAIVGDSITDGRGSTTNANNRWPDQLLARLRAANTTTAATVSLLNQAAGGNRVLADGLGPNALGRLERDVLAQPGVRYALIYAGVNDLGTAPLPSLPATATRLMLAYAQMVTRLHSAGVAAFGATLTPMSGPGQAYSDPGREAQRQRVNAWIRASGRFDGVVDFDAAVRDDAADGGNATQLAPAFDSGDYLHLNPAGYAAMAAAVDLSLFSRFAGGVHAMV
ncbi:SGNH hydrolase-type esterase domain-containing protein [Lasiosphaeria hispida]|uniref:SGNH hydrolase-type esterase domain-containing protein n=1 Tax=Lasiosphaeria hispida TaxID=260671 RepID=A0AAJ0H7D8_9PEZI|nr:SGNH hydrolase-type esterase domain-containing protein [Lasiosphaeria hispida]